MMAAAITIPMANPAVDEGDGVALASPGRSSKSGPWPREGIAEGDIVPVGVSEENEGSPCVALLLGLDGGGVEAAGCSVDVLLALAEEDNEADLVPETDDACVADKGMDAACVIDCDTVESCDIDCDSEVPWVFVWDADAPFDSDCDEVCDCDGVTGCDPVTVRDGVVDGLRT